MSEDPLAVTDNDEALAGLVNLIVVLADNKYFLGRHLSEWAVGAPTLEASIGCCAVAQAQMGHARVLYPLLEDLPSPVPPGPPGQETGRERRYSVAALDEPFPTWPHAAAALFLIDNALNTLVRALTSSRYDQLAARCRRMLDEEEFHRDLAAGRVYELSRFDKGPAALQERVDAILPEMLCWFGPAGEVGVEALRGDGLMSEGSEGMRQDYLDRVAPLLLDLAVKVPLRRTGGGWEYGELPWARWNH
ncbi:MAG: Phenylacetic acid catabolic protein, partial [Egibacteraceae bacterium]